MKTKHIIENEAFVHDEHKNWLSQLDFYRDEIKFFQNELSRVVQQHSDSFSAFETVEEYKKIFEKKLMAIDQMHNAIKKHEKELAYPPEMDDTELMDHQLVRDRFLEFVEKFETLKKNFKRFAAYND